MRFIFIISFSLIASTHFANSLSISNPVYNSATNKITFAISWSNAWKVPTTGSNFSSDGAWIFVKYAPNGGAAWQHLDILAASTSVANFNAQIGINGHGVMLIPDFCSNNNSCEVNNANVALTLDAIIGVNPDFKVFGMEMVKVPSDPFYLGDGVSDNTYYTYPDTLNHYFVNSSVEIDAGTSNGYINKKGSNFNSDVPADYPKGFREFWAMKYKISMEQYMEFLNTLDRAAQNNRTETDISGNSITNTFVMTNTSNVHERNPIRCDTNLSNGPVNFYCDLDGDGVPNEIADGQNLIATHMSSEDFMAFLDWAALRPHTNMELEKMSRGPLNPVAGEFAWGTTSFALNGFILSYGQATETFDNVGTAGPIWPDFFSGGFVGARCGFAATSTSTRLSAGATFYGILDVHSSGLFYIGETTTNLSNFHYFNSQGDGSLTSTGDSNVASWSAMTVNFVAPVTQIPISVGHTFSILLTSRISYNSGRGVVTLQP